MSGASGLWIAGGILVVVAVMLVVGIGGLAVTTSESTSSEEPVGQYEPPPVDGSYGVVGAVFQAKSGISIHGWNITPSRWEALVSFVPPPGCTIPEEPGASVDRRVEAKGPCATIPAEGRISGGGTLEDGSRLWTVAFTISKGCYAVLKTADRWPTSKPECTPR